MHKTDIVMKKKDRLSSGPTFSQRLTICHLTRILKNTKTVLLLGCIILQWHPYPLIGFKNKVHFIVLN